MTAPQNADGAVAQVSTALAVTKDDLAALTPSQRALIAQRKNANIVAAQMAGTNWGKGLDVQTQRAVSDWGQRTGIDVATEIFVLGGSIYLNAQLYINRGIDLIAAGKLLDYNQRFIHHDPQLDDILREVLPATASDAERADLAEAQAAARREIRERRELRIKHAVPNNPAIKACVLTEIVLTKMPHTPFYGVKWTPHPNQQHNDPVGTHYPQETALTRSARRAWKQVIRQVPEMQRYVAGAEEDAVENVEHLLQAHEERVQAEIAAAPQRVIQPGPIAEQVVAARKYDEAHGLGAHARVDGTVDEAAAISKQRMVPLGSYDDDADNPFAPDPPKGPVTETLFGTSEPMEATADEKAAAQAAEDAAALEEDRRIAAQDEELMRRNAARKPTA